MNKDSRIYIAGHRGLVGSALVRKLREKGFSPQSSPLGPGLLLRTHAELDLTNQQAVREFFEKEKPEYVFLAAAKVGGILANNTYPAEFIYQNLAIQTNVIHEAYRVGVKRLLFLGSSCIYPRDCPQPMKEEYLLTGPLESTNRPYAVAKIAGIEMCWAYNRQYGTQYLSVMPTNCYGPGDNYDINNSHVLPALIGKFHRAKIEGKSEAVVWGTGNPRREFIYSDDMADACVHLMNLPDREFNVAMEPKPGHAPLVNIGCGEDLSIRELAQLTSEVIGFTGQLVFDSSKPDGTPRKLLDVNLLSSLGWRVKTNLQEGLHRAYQDFLARYKPVALPK